MEREFQVDDWDYLRLLPYRPVAGKGSVKLPTLLQPISHYSTDCQVAYKLALPEESHIHPIFHVSCLKKKVGPLATPIWELPKTSDDWLIKEEPININRAVIVVLMQCSNMSPKDTSLAK